MKAFRVLAMVLMAWQARVPSVANSAKRPSRSDCSKCAGMTWVTTTCNGFYKFWYDSREISDIKDLPAQVRNALAAHLNGRLGKYAGSLKFERAFYVDVDGYFSRHPDEERRPSWPYSYDVQFTLRLSGDGPVDYCAQIGLDQSGGVLHEINLPNLAMFPELGTVLGASRLLDLAETLGVPVERATLDLKYDDTSQVLEYRVEYGVDPKEDGNNMVVLVVAAHDPSQYRWYRTRLVSSNEGHHRPDIRFQAPAGAEVPGDSEAASAGHARSVRWAQSKS